MINNDFYHHLGERWFTAQGDAVALLRLEGNFKRPWILAQIRRYHGSRACRVLDGGCGGGTLSWELHAAGHAVTALDFSAGVLAAARTQGPSDAAIEWRRGDIQALPFADASFDVVCLMDVLEHIPDPRRALHEAVRVLQPEGTLLFHTFNKTWLAWLFAAKGLDWFIKDSQKHIHDWSLFIRPRECAAWLAEVGWQVEEWTGVGPRLASWAFWRLVFTRRVPEDFSFKLGGGLQVGYLGCARRAQNGMPRPKRN